MKTKKFMLLALALGLPACGLLAQNDGPPPGGPGLDGPPGRRGLGGPGPGRRPPMPLIVAIDANHDGIINADEIANAANALKALDKNGDGQLTPDEYLPPRPPQGSPGGADGFGGPGPEGGPLDGPPPPDGQGRPPRRIPPILKALDANGDGIISAAEMANAPAALMSLDKNGDGKLTMDELMGPPPPRPDGNGQDGPPDGQRPPPPNENHQ